MADTTDREAAEATLEEVARRLCAAVLSVQLGLGLEYTYRQYRKVPVGDYWRQLALYIARNPPG